MAFILSQCLGAGSTAIQLANGDTRIYYQAADGAIHEAGGVGSVASGAAYSDNILIPAQDVRINTPVAVTTWGAEFEQIRLYFIGSDNLIRERRYTRNQTPWGPGGLDAKRYKAAPNSGLLYAIVTDNNPRVGFQSADAPESITEAAYTLGGGWVDAKLPRKM
ncbi:hypothetical protein BDZ97DRAFT_1757827 [Flammula alnicola]|nr:hypothetical protein BDZ97DRAFT_1757827 [Flammula alnicola]